MYAVIDIGSNTIRLVVYKIDSGKIISLINKKQSVGLANYVDENNNLSEKGIKKAIKTLNEFNEIISCLELEALYPFATASLRNISNTQEVLQAIKSATNLDINVITGSEEALYNYYGAMQSVRINDGIMIDVGGGSTKLVFVKDREVVATNSISIGSLNLYKNFVKNLIPSKEEILQIKKYVLEKLNENEVSIENVDCSSICAIGGTGRAIEKLIEDMGLASYENYPTSFLTNLVTMLEEDSANYYANLIQSSPDRVHTFSPGLLIFETIAQHYNSKTAITSRYGVREGYLYYSLQEVLNLPKIN